MLPFLENEIREIESLKKLVVVGVGVDVSFADATVKWIAERNRQNIREMTAFNSKFVLLAPVNRDWVCEFCKEEGHLWVDCYNLCSFCGAYGHLHEDCIRWQKSRAD